MTDTKILKDLPFFFISPDVKRGVGLELILPKFYIICASYDPLIPLIRKNGGYIFCLEEKIGLEAKSLKNSGQLLSHPLIERFIEKTSKGDIPNILFFKPNLKLDLLCQQRKYKKIGNTVDLNEQFENKINFFNLIQKYMPEYNLPGETDYLFHVNFQNVTNKLGLPFIIQFGHGWAGKTTFKIKSRADFLTLQKTYRQTQVKITKYIEGVTLLNNCCIYNNTVLIGPPAIQLNSHKILSNNNSTTCGRQWPATGLTKKENEIITNISLQVGSLMMERGYNGFFGLDFILDRHGKIYISENNARLTASTPFYTKIELSIGRTPLLLYHLASFLGDIGGLKIDRFSHPPIAGSQIIIRNLKDESVELKGNIIDGTYKIYKDAFVLTKNQYDIDKLKQGEFVILSQAIGKRIETDDEMARIELKDTVLEANYKLKPIYQNIIQKLRSKLN